MRGGDELRQILAEDIFGKTRKAGAARLVRAGLKQAADAVAGRANAIADARLDPVMIAYLRPGVKANQMVKLNVFVLRGLFVHFTRSCACVAGAGGNFSQRAEKEAPASRENFDRTKTAGDCGFFRKFV